jgi:very-short-patch-repair endonuclease
LGSYEDAKKDGIKITNYGIRGEYKRYVLKCSSCGEDIISNKYIRGKSNICDKCKSKDLDVARRVKEGNMLRIAKNKLSKMVKLISDESIKKEYQNAVSEVEKITFDQIKFDSSAEIMVAIELTKSHIPFKHHEKIAGYEVDFFLPDEKIILEVDGIIYHNATVELDKYRDDQILNYLGSDYRVVRVLDKSINYSVLNLMCIIEEYLVSGFTSSNYISDNWYYLYCLEHDT